MLQENAHLNWWGSLSFNKRDNNIRWWLIRYSLIIPCSENGSKKVQWLYRSTLNSRENWIKIQWSHLVISQNIQEGKQRDLMLKIKHYTYSQTQWTTKTSGNWIQWVISRARGKSPSFVGSGLLTGRRRGVTSTRRRRLRCVIQTDADLRCFKFDGLLRSVWQWEEFLIALLGKFVNDA